MAKIQLKVSMVILLYDVYTSRPVNSGTFSVITETGACAINKENGIFVLSNMAEMEYNVIIKSDIYQPKEIKITREIFEKGYVYVWLTPGIKYNLLRDSGILRGEISLDGDPRLIVKELKDKILLAEDYKAGQEEISLIHRKNLDYQGAELMVKTCEDKGEISLEERREYNDTYVYRLKRPWDYSIGKNTAELVVCHRVTGEKIYFPVREVPRAGCTITLFTDHGEKDFYIERGKETMIYPEQQGRL